MYEKKPYTYNTIMYVVFFIFLILLLILTVPFYFKIQLEFNFIINEGYIKIYLFKIMILHYNVKYMDKKFVLNNYKSSKEINVSLDKENIYFVNQLRKEIFKRIYLSKISILLQIGLKSNPAVSAIFSGLLHSIINILYSNISFQKPTSELKYDINTYYTKNMGIVKSEVACGSSILNILLSYIKAKKSSNLRFKGVGEKDVVKS